MVYRAVGSSYKNRQSPACRYTSSYESENFLLSVAPITNIAISPPLKPPPHCTTVKKIFMLPLMLLSISKIRRRYSLCFLRA